MTDNWISVETMVPEDGQIVLIFQPETKYSEQAVTDAKYEEGKFAAYNHATGWYIEPVSNVTHWQPLPPPPNKP